MNEREINYILMKDFFFVISIFAYIYLSSIYDLINYNTSKNWDRGTWCLKITGTVANLKLNTHVQKIAENIMNDSINGQIGQIFMKLIF